MDINNQSKTISNSTTYKDSPDHLPISRVLRPKDHARSSYNNISPIYDFISIGSEHKFIDLGVKKLNIQQDEKVLEVGFGTGYAILQLAKAVGEGGKTIGVDISEGMISQAEKKINKTSLADRIELVQADASDLPFKLDWFDAVFMR